MFDDRVYAKGSIRYRKDMTKRSSRLGTDGNQTAAFSVGKWCLLPAILAALLLQAGVATCTAANPDGPVARPNIIYILADDLGYGDVQCLNLEHGKIPTPNVDRLAKQGMVFTDAHSCSAVCTPSRYGILTGRYAWRTRLQTWVLPPYAPPLIAAERLTVGKLLQQNGYHTACIGKWHLGWNWPRTGEEVVFDQPIADGPTTHGFDFYFGTDVPNYPPFGFIENDRLTAQPTAHCEPNKALFLGRGGPMVPGWKFDQILPKLTEKAVEYIGRRAADRKPFFLYFPLTSPHEPIAPSARFRGKSGISPVGDFIMETDWAVGEVLHALDKHGLSDNTLVIFTADNGHGVYTGLKPFLDAGHRPSQRLRGYKADIWDGGHREPFIVRWPAKVKAGSTCNQLICQSDLIATCADILGEKLPYDAGEDSVSFWPALQGKNDGPKHEAVIHHSNYGRFAVRQGRWKLVLCPASGSANRPRDTQALKKGMPAIQLYDMRQDDRESVNVQDKHPEVILRLTKLLEKYVAEGRSTPGEPQKNDVLINIHKR